MYTQGCEGRKKTAAEGLGRKAQYQKNVMCCQGGKGGGGGRGERGAEVLGVIFAIGAVSVIFTFFGLLVVPLDGLQLRERRGQAEGAS